MNHYCEYTIKGCRCEGGVQEPDCDEVRCDKLASIKIYQQWFCEKHGDRVQAIIDRHEKGTPLPPDFFQREYFVMAKQDDLANIRERIGELNARAALLEAGLVGK